MAQHFEIKNADERSEWLHGIYLKPPISRDHANNPSSLLPIKISIERSEWLHGIYLKPPSQGIM
ncbi:MAG TPA: hypothetical protein PLL28_00430, partial [Chitinophagales bacterium]|nr:hypothetical protein [Chitinophagales bacterium]